MLRSLRPLRSTFLLVAAFCAPLALTAQAPAEIFARFNQAVDPEGKAASVEGMRSTLTMEIAAAGVTASITALHARPNLMALNIELTGIGQMRRGFDGTTAWASDQMQGPRLMTGAEAILAQDEADMRSIVRTMDLFSAVDPAGEAIVAGDSATCLKLTWKSGRVTTECYSVASGLLVEERQTTEAQGSVIDAVTHYSDYRMEQGLLMPHRMVSNAMGMQQVMTLVSVEFAPLPATLFELPPEIKALKP